MAHTDDDPVIAAGRRREAAWGKLNLLHKNPPDCGHLATLNTGQECRHIRTWRAQLARAMAAYRASITECDLVAAQCFIADPSLAVSSG
jgi:hypothetical protein